MRDFHRAGLRDEENARVPFLSNSIHEAYTIKDGIWQAKENTTLFTVWLLLSLRYRLFS